MTILLLLNEYRELFKYAIFYIPIFFTLFHIFNKKNSLVIVTATILSSILVSTLIVTKLSSHIDNKIVFGTITFIISSTIAIKYLKKRITSAEID